MARRLSPQSISFYNADDILLITPSVTGLEKLVHICDNELQYDMTINYAKSSCMRLDLVAILIVPTLLVYLANRFLS